jgi:hypothetical protein
MGIGLVILVGSCLSCQAWCAFFLLHNIMHISLLLAFVDESTLRLYYLHTDKNETFIFLYLQIFALYVTGSLNVVISPEHRREICRYIYNHQA